jgi:hypothetical protein
MIISKKKYIYMAVPKTGSTSVQKFLLENDKTATKNGAEIEGKFYRFREHMTASGIKTVLGIKYEDYTVIGFKRQSYSRLVSSYFFLKQGAKNDFRNGKKMKRFLVLVLNKKFYLPRSCHLDYGPLYILINPIRNILSMKVII